MPAVSADVLLSGLSRPDVRRLHLPAGVQEGGGGERDRAGPAEGHALGERGDGSRGVPLLLGHGVPQRLGE